MGKLVFMNHSARVKIIPWRCQICGKLTVEGRTYDLRTHKYVCRTCRFKPIKEEDRA